MHRSKLNGIPEKWIGAGKSEKDNIKKVKRNLNVRRLYSHQQKRVVTNVLQPVNSYLNFF